MIQQRYKSLSQCLDGIQECLEALEIKFIEKIIAEKYCEALLTMIEEQGQKAHKGLNAHPIANPYEAKQKYLIYLGSLVEMLNELQDTLQKNSERYNQFETDGLLDRSLTYTNYIHMNRQLIRIRTIVMQMKIIFYKSTEKLTEQTMVGNSPLNQLYEAVTFVKGCFETWEDDSPAKDRNIHEYFNKSKNLNVPHVLFEFIAYYLKQENYEEVGTLSNEFLYFYSDSKGNFRSPTGTNSVDFTAIKDLSLIDVESLHGQYMVQQAKFGVIWSIIQGRNEAEYEKSYALAKEMFNSPLQAYMPETAALLALHLIHGIGVPDDIELALPVFLESARLGESESCLRVGQIYAFNENLRDLEMAQYWLLQAAHQGEPEAMSALAQIYAYTEYFDINKALFWAHAGHEAGNADATYLLILIYVEGLDNRVNPNYKKAEELLKPIMHKDVMYKFYLGLIYMFGGFGLDKCWDLGNRYLTECVQEGYIEAMYTLGCIYADEDMIILPDDKAALRLLRQAERAGHSEAGAKIKELGLA